LPQSLLQKKNEERQFLEQLFDPTALAAYDVAVPIKAELRTYQEVFQRLEISLLELNIAVFIHQSFQHNPCYLNSANLVGCVANPFQISDYGS